jgi:hypothetical protein
MVEVSNVEVFGLERAVKASGYPKVLDVQDSTPDFERAKRLGKAPRGSGHDCFLKGITVYFDIKYPQYFSMQLQRYHFLDIVSSQSKMHMLSKMDIKNQCNIYVSKDILAIVSYYQNLFNLLREERVPTIYNVMDTSYDTEYMLYMRLLSNIPMGFEMTMSIVTNYLQLKTIYSQRRYHKLKEDWGAVLDMIENLPEFMSFIGGSV